MTPSGRRASVGTGLRGLVGRLRLKHLELFRAVCEKQTLRKAADASNMTQPAATKLIREMEDMLGVALFHRDRRGMRLTLYGDVVRRHVEIVLADVSNMTHEVRLVAEGSAGHIRLGIIPSLASELLALSMARTLGRWPQVRFSIKEAAATELLAHLARNDLDVTFGRVLDVDGATGLRVIGVYAEPFAIVCGMRHPLARRRNITWTELAQGRWVLPVGGTPLRELVDNLFTRNGALRPIAAVESSSFEKTRYVIARAALLGVLPRSIALKGKADKELALLRPSLGSDFAPVSLILRKGIAQPPLVEEFAKIVCETARDLKLDRRT